MSMTTDHIDQAALISLAQEHTWDPGATNSGDEAHFRSCTLCQTRAAQWRRIADAVVEWVEVVPPPGVHVLSSLDERLTTPDRGRQRQPVLRRPPARRLGIRPLVVASLAVVAGLVAAVLSGIAPLGPSGPSQAAALKAVRAAPAAAAASVSAREETTLLERAPQGYTLAAYTSSTRIGFSNGAFLQEGNLSYPSIHQLPSVWVLANGHWVFVPGNPLVGKQWIAYPADHGALPQLGRPLSYLSAASGPVEHLGTKTIGDTKVTGYAVTVPIDVLVAWQPKEFQGFARNAFAGAATARVQLWLNARGQPVLAQTRYRQHRAQGVKVIESTLMTRFTYSRRPFTVAAPPPSATAFVSGYDAAVGLQQQYERDYEACAPTHCLGPA
jgi:hypothetical protein